MMHNDSTLDGKYLGTVSADFVQVADRLQEAAYHIRKKGGYTYPVFVVSRGSTELGALLIAKGEMGNDWNYYASYLEALVHLKLVAEDKVEAFRQAYKDPDEFCCLLIIENASFHFVYIPYPVD